MVEGATRGDKPGLGASTGPPEGGGALKSSRAVDDGAESAPGTGGVCSRRLSPQFPRGSGRTRAPGNVLTLNCEQG